MTDKIDRYIISIKDAKSGNAVERNIRIRIRYYASRKIVMKSPQYTIPEGMVKKIEEKLNDYVSFNLDLLTIVGEIERIISET